MHIIFYSIILYYIILYFIHILIKPLFKNRHPFTMLPRRQQCGAAGAAAKLHGLALHGGVAAAQRPCHEQLQRAFLPGRWMGWGWLGDGMKYIDNLCLIYG